MAYCGKIATNVFGLPDRMSTESLPEPFQVQAAPVVATVPHGASPAFFEAGGYSPAPTDSKCGGVEYGRGVAVPVCGPDHLDGSPGPRGASCKLTTRGLDPSCCSSLKSSSGWPHRHQRLSRSWLKLRWMARRPQGLVAAADVDDFVLAGKLPVVFPTP